MKNVKKSIDLTAMSREELEKYAEKMESENTSLKMQLSWYEEQFRLSRVKRFGASSEKTDFEQMSFFNEAESLRDDSLKEPELSDVQQRRGQKRKGQKDRITRPLPKQIIEYRLTDEERVCPVCGEELSHMKKEVRKELTVIPAKVVVTEHVVHSYSCRNCDRNGTEGVVIRADAPKPLFRNSLVSASLLADIITKKYVDALPLYRQEKNLNRNGILLSRQTLSNWVVQGSGVYIEPLYALLHQELLRKDVLHADETTLEVLREPGRDAETKSYMWLYRTSGCDADRPVILYDYQESRSAECPENFLKGYHGYLQSDGYSVYPAMSGVSSGEIISVGCMAHVRRKYDEALKAMPPGADKASSLSAKGLDYCNMLFQIEREAEGLSYEDRQKLRAEKAKPIFQEFLEWAREKKEQVLPKSKLGDALTYTVKQAVPLGNYLLDGRLEISNNRAERSIKPFVIGRKNWLFSNTPNGARASAVLYSIVETAKECDLNVFRYLEHVFRCAPNTDMTDPSEVEKLLPYSKQLPADCYISSAAHNDE